MTDLNNLTCIAHRGASGYEPENTLRAFARAIELNCPWLELDVHMADGYIMVIHDEDLSRTTNGNGKISDCSYEYLRKLDAGHGESIPTLAEVLSLVSHRARVNIELKGHGAAEPVCSLLKELPWGPQEILISSFDHEELAQVDNSFTRGALFNRRVDSYVDAAKRINAKIIILDRRLTTRTEIDHAHEAGMELWVYTVNKPKHISKLKALGADGIFSDFPDRAIKIASEGR